jgi:hypothetical protein
MKTIVLILISNFIIISCTYYNKTGKIEKKNMQEINISTDKIFHRSWIFEPGEYYLIANNVNIYSQPKVDAKILENLKIHDRIIVIKDVHNEQDIDKVISCWYKIQYNQIIGYIWGGNIAVKTFIFDIDNNGINEYFQYRISWVAANYHYYADRDLIIYFNNKQVSSEIFINDTSGYNWFDCHFEKGKAVIDLSHGGPNYIEHCIFEMDTNGNISLKDIIKKGKIFENGKWIIYK